MPYLQDKIFSYWFQSFISSLVDKWVVLNLVKVFPKSSQFCLISDPNFTQRCESTDQKVFQQLIRAIHQVLRQCVFTPCKVIHDSLGFRIPWCGLQISGTGFKIPPQCIPISMMWTPDPTYWIQDSTSVDFKR